MRGAANSYIGVLYPFSVLSERKATRARREMGGVTNSFIGPSTPSERWTNTARREMGGVDNSYMWSSTPLYSFCKKIIQD